MFMASYHMVAIRMIIFLKHSFGILGKLYERWPKEYIHMFNSVSKVMIQIFYYKEYHFYGNNIRFSEELEIMENVSIFLPITS